MSIVAKHPTPFLLFFSGAAVSLACTSIQLMNATAQSPPPRR